MTFLNPFVLFGLVASAIPLILHLLNLRKLRTIEFSTLQFLKELQKTKIRRLKIKQLLLLILRTLLILLIVFAFSRPTLTGTLGAGTATARSSVVLVLDDSYSMTASNERGEYFKQALEYAERVIDLLKDGDEIYLVRTSQVNSVESEATTLPQRHFDALRATLPELRPVPIYRSLDDALAVAAQLLAQTTNLNKEIYVVSDFQEGAWKKKGTVRATRQPLLPPNARLFLLRVGTDAPHNVGIERVTVVSTILELGKPVTLKALVRNASERAVRNHLISVFLSGVRVAQQGISLDPGKTAEAEFSIVPRSTGYLQGSVETESDDVEFDNRRYFSLYVPERMRVLLCGSSNDLRYVRLALATRMSEDSSPLLLSEITPERLSHGSLASADVLVLANPSQLTPAQAQVIKDFVSNGGGMIFFPGTQMQPTLYNSTLAGVLQIPRIVNVEQSAPAPAANAKQSPTEFQSVDLRHPLFQGMFEEQSKAKPAGVIGAPAIVTHVRYFPAAMTLPIITLSNGAPFLLEHPVGRGRVLLFAISATTDWSDFPFQSLFVPILHRSVSYLVAEQSQPPEAVVGEPVMLNLARAARSNLAVRTPDELVTPLPYSSGSLVRFADTRIPGVYTVSAGNQTVAAFVVNMEPAESLTRPKSGAEIEQYLEQTGIPSSVVFSVTEPLEVPRIVSQSRFGMELWKHFLIAALAIALLEMFIARDQKRDLASLSANPV